MGALFNLIAILASMALLEFYVLRRYYGRRSLAECIFIGAFISGILWAAIIVSIVFSTARLDVRQTTLERLLDFGTSLVIYALFISVLALIPSGVAAMIYRKLIQTP